MLLTIRPMCRVWKLLEDVDIPVDSETLAERLEKNKAICMKHGTYVMPRGTVICVSRWREDTSYCYPTIHIRIKDNKGNPWAGCGAYLNMSVLKDIVFDVEEIS